MTSRDATRRVVPFLALALTLACGTPPEKEIAGARQAIESARAAGADRHAPAELAGASDALARAESAVARRDFRLALSEALDAVARAQDAGKAAAAREAALRSEASAAVAAVEAAVGRLRDAIAAAEAARPSRHSRQAISDARRVIVVANVTLQEARAALGRDDHVRAKDACAAVQARLDRALTALAAPSPSPPADPRR